MSKKSFSIYKSVQFCIHMFFSDILSSNEIIDKIYIFHILKYPSSTKRTYTSYVDNPRSSTSFMENMFAWEYLHTLSLLKDF